MKKNEMTVQGSMSLVGKIPITSPNRELSAADKKIIFDSVLSAFQPLASVRKVGARVQVKKMVKAYCDQIGLTPLNQKWSEKESKRKELSTSFEEKLQVIRDERDRALSALDKEYEEIASKRNTLYNDHGLVNDNSGTVVLYSGSPNMCDEARDFHVSIQSLLDGAGGVELNKLQMRLALAGTVGEVHQIIRAAFGNEVLPDVETNERTE